MPAMPEPSKGALFFWGTKKTCLVGLLQPADRWCQHINEACSFAAPSNTPIHPGVTAPQPAHLLHQTIGRVYMKLMRRLVVLPRDGRQKGGA